MGFPNSAAFNASPNSGWKPVVLNGGKVNSAGGGSPAGIGTPSITPAGVNSTGAGGGGLRTAAGARGGLSVVGANVGSSSLPNRVRAVADAARRVTPSASSAPGSIAGVGVQRPRLPGGASTALGLGFTALGTAQGIATGQGPFEALGGNLGSNFGGSVGTLTGGLIESPANLVSLAATGSTAGAFGFLSPERMGEFWGSLGASIGARIDGAIGSFFPNRDSPRDDYQTPGGGSATHVLYYEWTNAQGRWSPLSKRVGPDYSVEFRSYEDWDRSQWAVWSGGEVELTRSNYDAGAKLRNLELVDPSITPLRAPLPDDANTTPETVSPPSTGQSPDSSPRFNQPSNQNTPNAGANQTPRGLDAPQSPTSLPNNIPDVIPMAFGGLAVPAGLIAAGGLAANFGAGPTNAPNGALRPGDLVGSPPGLPGGAGSTPSTQPPPQQARRTRRSNSCGCNRGLLNSLAQLLTGGAGDAAELGLLAKINATTTATSAGVAVSLTKLQAMQQFAETAWKATHADKIINLLTLATTLHNASMISRDIGETMGYVLSNALAVVGIKDEHDSPLDVNELVGDSVESFIKSVVGEDVYDNTAEFWQKSNRVLSAASNIVWTLRSINDASQEVLEWTAENTGKIGNALKKYGVVGERSYPWMAERVQAQDAHRRKLSQFFDGLESAENIANSLSQVTSNVREIQDEVSELGEARQRFSEAVTDLAPEATPTASPENQAISTADIGAAAASQSPEVNISVDGSRGPDPHDTP